MDRLIKKLFIIELALIQSLLLTPAVFCQSTKTSELEKKIQTLTNHIERKYNVKPHYKNIPKSASPKYIYQEASPEDLLKLFNYLKIFYEELSKYPKTFFQNKDIKSIFFVKKLFFQEKPAEGLYSYKDKNIFFDFSRNEGNILSKRHSVHHEFYHMMDIMQPGWRNPLWNTFNSPDFVYGKNAVKNMADGRGKTYKIFRERKGFITPYSMTSAEEDKAEIYACLMVKSQNVILHRWIRDDPILAKKTQYIKNRIGEFCPEMNQAYWNQLFKE